MIISGKGEVPVCAHADPAIINTAQMINVNIRLEKFILDFFMVGLYLFSIVKVNVIDQ